MLNYVGEHHLDEPLKGIGLFALYGGVVLYLLGHIGFRLRNMGSVNVPRVVTVFVLVGLVPLMAKVPALVALGGLAAVCAGSSASRSGGTPMPGHDSVTPKSTPKGNEMNRPGALWRHRPHAGRPARAGSAMTVPRCG